MDGVTVDWNRITVADFVAHQAQNVADRDDVQLMMAVVVRCPFGDPADEATYDELSVPDFDGFHQVVMVALPDVDGLRKLAPEGVKVSWDRIKRKDFRKFQRSGGDVGEQVGLLQRIVTQCPKEWGEPNEPETYLKMTLLMFRAVFQYAGDQRAKQAKK